MTWLKQFFQYNTSFRNQQQLAIMLTCAILLIISVGSLLTYDYISFNRESRSRLSAMADIIAADIEAALAFGDYKSIQNSLSPLEADPAIKQLFVLNDTGDVIAYYAPEANNQMPADIAQRLKHVRDGLSNVFFDLSPKVSRPISHDKTLLGSILLEQDGRMLISKLLVSGGIGSAILLLSLLGSYLIARWLSQIITDPLLLLTATMDEVSRTKDYRLRAEISEVSELAKLADGFNGMLEEIARRDEALLERQDRLHRLANYDTLTGLPNRTLFNDRLEQALRRSGRSDEKLAVLFIDLDDFKNINDTHGHRIGDLMLEQVARRLEQETRADDTLGRLGGDEFTVVLHDIKSEENALLVGRKHIKNLLAAYQIEDKRLFVSASIGISIYPDHGDTAEVLVKSADTAMYHAKEKGKNHIELFTHTLYSKVSERLLLQGDLHQALEQGEFVLYYQPRVDLFTGHWSGVEALVRWQHPQRGLIPPLTFIPLLEDNGMILQLGEWVLREACQQLQRWHQAGIRLPRVSVNVSPLQFQRQNIVELVKNAISDTSLCAQALELEITESALMNDMNQSIIILNQLQSLGVNISIDDFGTGYSSLSHLRTLPVNILKIDRSFLLHAHESEEDAQIMSAIIEMAHSLHLDVVVEGVECQEHESLLLALRCREAQGFFYAVPMPADELEQMLREGSQALKALGTHFNVEGRQQCTLPERNWSVCGDNPDLVCLQVPGRPPASLG